MHPARGLPAVRVPVRTLWESMPELTLPVLTGMDPFWIRAYTTSDTMKLDLRLWTWGLGGDGFDRGGFSIVGGASRTGVYAWPTCLKARRVPPFLVALLRKDQTEHQVGSILQREFPGRALAIKTDALVEVAAAPADAEVYHWGPLSRCCCSW